MRHKPDIRTVDPHAKRIRRHRHIGLAIDKSILRIRPRFITETTVIHHQLDLFLFEHLRHRLHSLTGRAINHPRLMFRNQSMETIIFLRFARRMSNAETQIWPRKTRDKFRRIFQPKSHQNIRPHHWRRCRRKCRRLRMPQFLQHLPQSKIIGPKIVSPHRETMRFIHRKQRDFDSGQCSHKCRAPKPFRCDINQFIASFLHAPHHLALAVQRERRIDQCRRNSLFSQAINLILHQRDQRRNNDCHPLQQHRRKLKTQRFSPTRRHYRQHIFPIEDRLHHRLLGIEKLPKTEIFF